MVVYAGQGDVRRSMGLLWREVVPPADRTSPGPKPALTVDAILAAAVAVADEVGMARLSMRLVGERLACTAMALYKYVPSKGELVDLMYDVALGELVNEYDPAANWRQALTTWARRMWDLYLRHPWLLQVSQVRPVLGPNEYTSLEALLHVLHQTGLPGSVVRHVIGVVPHFVRGVARTVTESRQAPTTTGVSDEDWWTVRSSMLLELVPDFPERFPSFVRLLRENAASADDNSGPYLEKEAARMFETGLAIILDGVAARTVTLSK